MWDNLSMHWELLKDYMVGFWRYSCDMDECCRR